MITLRPYQQEAVDAILAAWQSGSLRTLLILPTGCGKTVVFSRLAQQLAAHGKRVLILAHRSELLTQAADKLKAVTGMDAALEKAESDSLGSLLPVTIGSVQTLAQPRRLERFLPSRFDVIIVDEAHHCLSDSYQRVLKHFPAAQVLGVTATPDRGDKKSLADYFESVAYEYRLSDAVRDHYLCPVRARLISLKMDLTNIRLSAGDYDAEQLSATLYPALHRIADEMVTLCRNRKTVVFLPLNQISCTFRDMLAARGFAAAEVDGETPNRADILQDFANGRYNVLCNSMLLTEGWDCPAVDCIVILRPTKLRGLYQQMVGRGMRLSPGKDHLLLLDFLWLTTRHDLCTPARLFSETDAEADRADAILRASADEDLDLQGLNERVRRDALQERLNSLNARLSQFSNSHVKTVNPIEYALSISAEDLADYEPVFAWEHQPPTEKQLAFLQSKGFAPADINCKGKASMLIGKLIRRAELGLTTPKQIKLLSRFGFTHVGDWAFAFASAMLKRLADNHWKLPVGFDAASYVPPQKYCPPNSAEDEKSLTSLAALCAPAEITRST